jgi:plasmid stability protein
MADLLVELDDRTIHALLRRAESAGRSLNDEMLSILRAAAAD